MTKAAVKVANVNVKNVWAAYLSTGIVAATMIVQTVIYIILSTVNGVSYENSSLSAGTVMWLLPVLAAILIPSRNFRRTMNLGARRGDFVWGSLIAYIMLSLFGALANTVIYYTLDRFVQNGGFFNDPMFGGVMNLTEIFGWVNNGMIVAFFQQFAFILMVCLIFHTLTAIQGKIYGWITDAVIAAIVSIFVPIASLRSILIAFFNLIIFQPNPLLQILCCLVLGFAVFSLNGPIIARKTI